MQSRASGLAAICFIIWTAPSNFSSALPSGSVPLASTFWFSSVSRQAPIGS